MSRIDSPFTFHSTADEVLAGVDLTGKTAIVTGGASGIGAETARALAAAGATVTVAVRNTNAARPVIDELNGALPRPIQIALLDLADRASIAAFVAGWSGPLDILVNNAGVMATPETRSWGGHELQFATNHLGHFALAHGLHDALSASGDARIVAVSSSAHQRSPIVFDDINFRFRIYEPWAAYGQSKTANILFAVEATRRWADDGIIVNALNPGAIATNLQRHIGGKLSTPADRQKTVQEGAATSVFLAASPVVNGIGGRYLEDVAESELTDHRDDGYTGLAPYAIDPSNAERLWELSHTLLDIPPAAS
jgi:NAD(P)-dependent dehydrogenase (short-subunit alcohol dehydrogenase family)